jgi:hypothetical protein
MDSLSLRSAVSDVTFHGKVSVANNCHGIGFSHSASALTVPSSLPCILRYQVADCSISISCFKSSCFGRTSSYVSLRGFWRVYSNQSFEEFSKDTNIRLTAGPERFLPASSVRAAAKIDNCNLGSSYICRAHRAKANRVERSTTSRNFRKLESFERYRAIAASLYERDRLRGSRFRLRLIVRHSRGILSTAVCLDNGPARLATFSSGLCWVVLQSSLNRYTPVPVTLSAGPMRLQGRSLAFGPECQIRKSLLPRRF